MLTIEQNDEEKTLQVSVSCDDCECDIHPIHWIDAVHCRCGRASCDPDYSNNHDGTGCFDLGACRCLPLAWSEPYVEAIEIYFGQHPETKEYKVVGLYDSEPYEEDELFAELGEDSSQSLKYAVADTVLAAASDAGVVWKLKYKFAGPWERPYSNEFFLDWNYTIVGGCSLTVGLQEDRTVVVIHSFPEYSGLYSVQGFHTARAGSFDAASRPALRKYLAALLCFGQDCFRSEQSWERAMEAQHGVFSLWGLELEEQKRFDAEQKGAWQGVQLN